MALVRLELQAAHGGKFSGLAKRLRFHFHSMQKHRLMIDQSMNNSYWEKLDQVKLWQ